MNLPGDVKRLRIRCANSGIRKPVHDKSLDPADHRRSKTKRCGCSARINIRILPSGNYYYTAVELTHNHPAVHNNDLPKFLPPSDDQKRLVLQLSSLKALGRTDLHTLLSARFPDHPLSLR